MENVLQLLRKNRCVRVSFLCPFVSFLLLPHLIDSFDWVWIMKGDLFSPRALSIALLYSSLFVADGRSGASDSHSLKCCFFFLS